MNTVHMKYAVEVARFGSINKASESLGMAQPNISRAIKDLEADLGISIFDRSAKGMNLTPEGKDFIATAQEIINQLNQLEHFYKGGNARKQKFSVSVPNGAYISDAIIEFSKAIQDTPTEIVFHETGAQNTIKKVSSGDCSLGIIRYDLAADKFFKDTLGENGLDFEILATYKYVLLMSQNCKLTELPEIRKENLKDMLQIAHTTPYAATIASYDIKRDDLKESSDRCIYTLDTATQFELLSENTDAFMWVSPIPERLLEKYKFAQMPCIDNDTEYAEVLIYQKGYKQKDFDKLFIEKIKKSINNCFNK